MSMYPKEIRQLAEKLARKHTSAQTAKEKLRRAARLLPSFAEFADALIDAALDDLIDDVRHSNNRIIRRKIGKCSSPKVVIGESKAVKEVYAQVFLLHIAGTQLGLLRGKDLLPAAAKEEACGNGHLANARLCRRIHETNSVTEDQLVGQGMTGRKLFLLANECGVKIPA